MAYTVHIVFRKRTSLYIRITHVENIRSIVCCISSGVVNQSDGWMRLVKCGKKHILILSLTFFFLYTSGFVKFQFVENQQHSQSLVTISIFLTEKKNIKITRQLPGNNELLFINISYCCMYVYVRTCIKKTYSLKFVEINHSCIERMYYIPQVCIIFKIFFF